MAKVTPDRGHPVAQQVVLGSFAVMAIALLMLVACSQAYRLSPPLWVWRLFEEVLGCLGVVYARVWVWPPTETRRPE